ncbi:MAG: bifunctional phosphoserine phosphatase/homoserine phosphotransferase ThrH, partial [SAR324 cluster bacterium]|nr:bifunctional phosphoserine phosphatase/homoserine phosphotransferase ThrH [SAR324 cluster bacterium]
AVRSFINLNFKVTAVGDSYNDLTMLEEADHAVLFRPPDRLIKEKPEYPRVKTHEELKKHLQNIFSSMIES